MSLTPEERLLEAIADKQVIRISVHCRDCKKTHHGYCAGAPGSKVIMQCPDCGGRNTEYGQGGVQ